MPDHLPDGAQGNRNPPRILVCSERVQQIEIWDGREQVDVRAAAGARCDLHVILVAVACRATHEQRRDLEVGRLGWQPWKSLNGGFGR